MSRRAQENLVILLLLAFFGAALYMSLGYSPRARLVPVPLCSLAILLLLFQLAWQNLRSDDELNVDIFAALTARPANAGAGAAAAGPPDDPEPAAHEDADGTWRRILIANGFVALLVAMAWALGPIPAVFIFTCGYFMLSRHFSPVKAVAYTSGFTLAVYVVFVQVLQLQLYNGYLQPLVDLLRRL